MPENKDRLVRINLYFNIDLPLKPGTTREEAEELIRNLFREYVNSEHFGVRVTKYTRDAAENITAFNMEVTR